MDGATAAFIAFTVTGIFLGVMERWLLRRVIFVRDDDMLSYYTEIILGFSLTFLVTSFGVLGLIGAGVHQIGGFSLTNVTVRALTLYALLSATGFLLPHIIFPKSYPRNG